MSEARSSGFPARPASFAGRIFIRCCVALLALIPTVSLAQVAHSGRQLEDIARQVAIAAGVEDFTVVMHRWSSNQFPLRVSFVIGPSARAHPCSQAWKEQFDSFVAEANAWNSVVASVQSFSKNSNALLFLGTRDDLERSGVNREIHEMEARPDFKFIGGIVSRERDYDFTVEYGNENSPKLSMKFLYQTSDYFAPVSCADDRIIPEAVDEVLLRGLHFTVRSRLLDVFDPDPIDPHAYARVSRRLLTAMRQLPETVHDIDALQRAFIQNLQKEP